LKLADLPILYLWTWKKASEKPNPVARDDLFMSSNSRFRNSTTLPLLDRKLTNKLELIFLYFVRKLTFFRDCFFVGIFREGETRTELFLVYTYNVHFCVDHRTLEEAKASVCKTKKMARRRLHWMVPFLGFLFSEKNFKKTKKEPRQKVKQIPQKIT